MNGAFLHLVDKPSLGRVLLLILPVAVWLLLDVSTVLKNFSGITLKGFTPDLLLQHGQHRLGDDDDVPGGSADLAYDAHRAQRSRASRNKACNYAKGKWVADVKRPLYSGNACKQWLSKMWSCRGMERTDFSYEGYRWQPHDCQMPEFSGPNFLHRMRHKTLAFVGDSLGREQFQSMMCIATGGKHSPEVEDVRQKYGIVKASSPFTPGGSAYRFPETNTTILFYWSPTLSEHEPLMNMTTKKTSNVLHIDRPADFLKKYLHSFDILVLNTGHHWNRVKFWRNHWKLYNDGKPVGNGTLVAKDFSRAREIKLHNIARWVDSELVHHPRTKVFLRTISPEHFVNGEWNTGGRCDNTIPLSSGSEVLQDRSGDLAAESAVNGTRLKLLDITAISQLRSEGHISNHSVKAQRAVYDCLHWCLPGIPDMWNELLFAQMY
ncbi:protein trichome birefringence-like 14 [Lolium perenne]|uniref:protein trichome birefringence-like 14 n=1 Tax=Lolium perenne TaxID=4522 RepID=UPI0021EB1343|nr:protein trichome birefringence-like 14 [Lolium perenne]